MQLKLYSPKISTFCKLLTQRTWVVQRVQPLSQSQEVVPNGCMVLILRGRLSSNPLDMESCFTWELLAITIAELVSQMQENDKWVRGEKFAKVARAFTEPIISNQFEHEIMDKLYDKFTHIVVSDLEAKIPKTTSCFSMGRPDLKRKLHLVKWKEKEELNKLSEELCLAPSLNGNDEDKPVLLAAQSVSTTIMAILHR
ncbi:hypothetical protein HYC85_000911 [Camellia sinensis]|uniref:Uncharacterized protein n=1 Tax=Camellia sinensis TaxID=4442 RepID=A0A7J7I3U3_CAMSI|nr:hypothetical protein HYC85_000911 [Camellia sinensis]